MTTVTIDRTCTFVLDIPGETHGAAAAVVSPAPTLTSVSPSVQFSLLAGQSLTLIGTGFSGSSVSVDNVPATSVVVVSSTEITCVCPALGGLGAKDVKVTNSDGQSDTLEASYQGISSALWLDPNDAAARVLDGTFTKIVTANDKSGNARNYTQATSGKQPMVDQIGGVGCLRFVASSGTFLQGPGYTGFTAAEIFLVCKLDADPPAGAQALYGFGSSSGNGAPLHPFGNQIIYDVFGTTVRKTTVDPVTPLTNVHTYSVTSKAGSWTSRINNEQIFNTPTNTFGMHATVTTLGGGSSVAGQIPPDYCIDARVGEVIMFNRELTPSERVVVKAYIEAKWYDPWPHTILICDGDSITAGSTINPNYPTQLAHTKLAKTLTVNGSLLPVVTSSGYTLVNFGTDGDTLANMLATRATFIDPYVNVLPKNVLIIGGGSNDLAYGQKTGAQLYSTMLAYCIGARAAGWQVIPWTLLPRSGILSGTTKAVFDAQRDIFNGLVRTGWPAFADRLADMAADPTMGWNGAELDPNLYYDAVHPTSVGAGYLADVLKPLVQSLS